MSRIDTAPQSGKYNILLLSVDQLRFPRFAYGPQGGFVSAIKEILGFDGPPEIENEFTKFYPGFVSLRKHAAVFRNHTIAASACIPSRAAIYTGQYGTRTRVTQTDGLFKSGDAAAFPWLPPDGVPTIGHWFKKAGYSTHYFGKWHVSNPPEKTLVRYGFDDWELSYPEPHGSAVNNLGTYRDHGFADLGCAFLRRMALGMPYNRASAEHAARSPQTPAPEPVAQPWLAVISLTNPHDIAAYPALPRQMDPGAPKFGPLHIPAQGTSSAKPNAGTWSFPLNPQGFPQACAELPPNLRDPLLNKPRCQLDYSFKMGLALAAKTGFAIGEAFNHVDAVKATLKGSIPFRLYERPDEAARLFIQYYAWLIHAVDAHIDRVLRTLDDCGLRENTIVVFFADHGEYGGSHGYMMEKWHAAYQEVLHVPLVVQSPHLVREPRQRHIDALTSHVDILPTLLSLAGLTQPDIESIRDDLRLERPVPPFVGADLSPLARGETQEVIGPEGIAREGVLFVTDDEITKPLPPTGDAHQEHDDQLFEVFLGAVEALCGENNALPENDPRRKLARGIVPGPVRQPNHVRCVRTKSWKLARYWDPKGEHRSEWELYNLDVDPTEMHNLLVFDAAEFPTAAPSLPEGITTSGVMEAARALRDLLERYETEMLSPWPAA